MDTRAINLRLGDWTMPYGHVKALEIVGELVEIRFVDDEPNEVLSLRWDVPVHVREAARRLPEKAAAPRPAPKPRAPKMWG